MADKRTVLFLVLILNIVTSLGQDIDDIKSDQLLRGSEEIDNEEDETVNLRDIIEREKDKAIENEETTTTEVTTTTDFEDLTTTMSPISSTDNNVYTEIVDVTNSEMKMETSSLPTTTRVPDDIESPESDLTVLDSNQDLNQRVPKLNDNAEPKQQDKRNYDVKPIPTPTASKSATLRGWLEDSWLRPPAGILVPLRPVALTRALAVWNDLTVEGLNLTDIVIVGYDANGVSWRSRHSLLPTRSNSGQRSVAEALSKLLLKYQDINVDSNSDGTMRALVSASKLVPYDSALFVVTDKGAADVQRLPLALRALVEKRLKVYTIWTDPTHPSAESEHQLQALQNVSKHTEGEVLPYSLQVMDMDSSGITEPQLQLWEPSESPQPRRGRVQFIDEEKFDTLLVRRGGGEAISLGVPVENGVSALRIYIEGLVEHAVLYPPNDAPQIDLYNETSVLAFSPKSRTGGVSPRDIYLVFPGADIDGDMLSVLPAKPTASDVPAPTVGVWHLSVRCDTCDYRLHVSARALVHFYAVVEPKEMLKIRVVGPVASVRESVLIDEYGTELATLPFSYQPIDADGQQMLPEGPPAELIADVTLPSVKGSRVYAKIVGRDVRGEPFVRLSGPLNEQEVRMGRSASVVFPESDKDTDVQASTYERLQYNESSILPFNRAVSQIVNQRGSLLTSVQIGLGTRLYGAPGDSLQLQYEVTNYRDQSIRFVFQAQGELRFLRGINPNSQWIASGQTATVIVSVVINTNAQPGARDLVTFTATGLEQVSISSYVYVINVGQTQADVWPPEVRHNFQGSCIGRLGDDCAQHIWSATVIARDAASGLLRLTSSPIGLMYDSNFIAGSREEVTAIYRATCCAPRVIVTAVDSYGNANSHIVDISSYLTGAAIASIVLGVFLFIALVAIIVFFIYWCVRRRKESRELPYTTSSSRNIS